MPLDVCIAGAAGAVGRRLTEAVLSSDAFRLVAAVVRRGAGSDIGALIGGAACGVIATDDLEAALGRRPQVLIDYTHPSSILRHIDLAFAARVPVVIGTTGLTDADFERIDAAARRAGVGAATGNFSITAALMQHLAKIAAHHVPHWEVVEYAKAEKPDVPSGTARELAEMLGKLRRPHIHLADDQLIGPRAARGAEFGGARVHSIRLPGCGNAVEVIFGLKGERLILRHDEQQDQSIFVQASLLAAERIQSVKGLVRGLDALLFAGA
ncbi:MAG: 4-hydroxy-tetrahydrodipicolinate reductase [Alphaproteobacteria bacterium]|nr:4-hydroxy-tetrahydrodipicolinate reductase [Alphaproteobacteria bacterium]